MQAAVRAGRRQSAAPGCATARDPRALGAAGGVGAGRHCVRHDGHARPAARPCSHDLDVCVTGPHVRNAANIQSATPARTRMCRAFCDAWADGRRRCARHLAQQSRSLEMSSMMKKNRMCSDSSAMYLHACQLAARRVRVRTTARQWTATSRGTDRPMRRQGRGGSTGTRSTPLAAR